MQSKKQSGVILVYFVLCLPLIFAFCALVIDINYHYVAKADLQNIADVSAHSGALFLKSGKSRATHAAKSQLSHNLIMGNRLPTQQLALTFGHMDVKNQKFMANQQPYNAIKVKATYQGTYFLSQFFGIDAFDVSATSIASQPDGQIPTILFTY